MRNNSQLLNSAITLIYPAIIIFGIYLIINGHISPGGGFQGGAILSAVFIIGYLANPEIEISLRKIIILEKIFYIIIIILPIIYIFYEEFYKTETYNLVYAIIMNVLIGFKVFSGFTIIFFRFVLFESR